MEPLSVLCRHKVSNDDNFQRQATHFKMSLLSNFELSQRGFPKFGLHIIP